MSQAVISTRVALTLVAALWGFASWLDQPNFDDAPDTAPVAVDESTQNVHLRCAPAHRPASPASKANRVVMVSFAPEGNVAGDFDARDAALLQCHVVN